MTFNPQPKPQTIRLKGKAKTEFKRRLYNDRAKHHCETCGQYVHWTVDGSWSLFFCAHLSHIKSYGAGGGDTDDNVKILCWTCHIASGHLAWMSDKKEVGLWHKSKSTERNIKF